MEAVSKSFIPYSRIMSVLCMLLCTAVLLDFSCHPVQGHKAGPYMPVTRVVDGDTFWADDGSEDGLKVRLIGVDAPETRNTARKTAGYYGPEARNFLTQLLAEKRVRLEYDVTRYDQYHRTLAYVFLEDGTFVNAALLKGGYAVVLTVPPNVRYADEFLRLQRKARRQERGLWAGHGVQEK